MTEKRRAAHFLLLPELAHSPPNDALVTALLELGYAVDLYTPGGELDVSRYGPSVTVATVEYGYRWLARNLFLPKWRGYSVFSGTTEDPMAVAGALARVWRRPAVTLADEIKSGSYAGSRSQRWKALCRSGMRRSTLTIVNEQERVSLQREYAGLTDSHAVEVYPGCFREPPRAWGRSITRRKRGIPEDALLVCYSGVMNFGNGGVWLAKAMGTLRNVWWWGQIVHSDPLVYGLLQEVCGRERLVIEEGRMSWRDAWASMGAVDVGIVVYLQDAPQFRHMGIASNRLCMFLAMGVPVIATKQPSFKFVETYNCGKLVENEHEFIAAIGKISGNLDLMKTNALRCSREYIDAPGRYGKVKAALETL